MTIVMSPVLLMCHRSPRALGLALARVIGYVPRVTLLTVTSLADHSRVVIYDHHMFIVQATGACSIIFVCTIKSLW
jgi:hypothetical protein